MKPAHTGLAVLVAALWGVNFVVIDIGLAHFPPLLFCALRFLLAALPAVFLVGRPCVPWRWIAGVGLALGVGKFGLLFVGMNAGMPAGLSSLVLQVQAVFTALIAFAFLGERPRPVRVAGMAVALAGIAVAALDETGEGGTGPLGAFALVLVAAAFWGVSNVLTRKASPSAPFNFMVWSSAVPVLPLLALSLLFEGPARDARALSSLDAPGIGAIVYVALVTTLFGFSAWSRLLRRYDASTVAPYSLLVPVFGMSSAALFLGEPVSPLRWVAAALLVAGVGLTSLGAGLRLPGTVRRRPRAAGASRAVTRAPEACAARSLPLSERSSFQGRGELRAAGPPAVGSRRSSNEADADL
ncbi:EamA family transporter [Streptomyces sp. SID8379]|uniref:EamA family transporter n=1 Tax=unclassified Streptomyces TaxID=2593676 RepID=UPI00035E8506|nr:MULTISPECIES: EamA family transporter [unclassified Streptomyces]MYW65931.1 EamA family transporter [Streptomyces sp. SID8379]